MEMIRAYLIRHGWLRKPLTSMERCGWVMIGHAINAATPHRRLS